MGQIAVAGAILAFDPRQEPLTYYHRTGPVGAMFRELRTRKGGADAKAHVAMVGLGTGSRVVLRPAGAEAHLLRDRPGGEAARRRHRQVLHLRRATPETRGADVDFRMGDARLKLKEDADRKYALLLVDAFSSDSIPVHLLTKEAVSCTSNRITDDGILALHISNKYVQLEPVVAQIAERARPARCANATARVWNDDSGAGRARRRRAGWCWPRTRTTLGDRSGCRSRGREYGTKHQADRTFGSRLQNRKRCKEPMRRALDRRLLGRAWRRR